MEDLDRPRVRPHAADGILRSLERLGLHWDDEVVYQSTRTGVYRDAIHELQQRRLVYPCACTRAMLEPGKPYPGNCRNGLPPGKRGRSLRVRADGDVIRFDDAVQGPFEQDVAGAVGDFIVRRADGITAYHLAVVIDDTRQRITEVVRGTDLLDSTPRQICLQRRLGHPVPAYAHLPVAVTADGRKLSKQNRAPPIDQREPAEVLWAALEFLGQQPPPELNRGPAGPLLEWAVSHWTIAGVPRVMMRVVDDPPHHPRRPG